MKTCKTSKGFTKTCKTIEFSQESVKTYIFTKECEKELKVLQNPVNVRVFTNLRGFHENSVRKLEAL